MTIDWQDNEQKRCILKYGCTLLLLFGFVLVGCSPKVTNPGPVSSNATEMVKEHTLQTPASEKTQTFNPTITPTQPARIKPPSATSAPTQDSYSTLTPLPTLPPDEAEKFIYELLQTNGDCDFPCWWGIVPGETPWLDAKNFFISLGLVVSSKEYPGFTLHGLSGLDIDAVPIRHRFMLTDKQGIVQEIHLYSEGFSDPTKFMTLWNSYSPRSLISKYGVPSRVLLEIVNSEGYGDTGTNLYNLVLIFDNNGIATRYTGLTKFEDPLSICLDHLNGDPLPEIYVLFQSPYQEFSETQLSDWIGYMPQYALPIEDATGFSITEFSEQIVHSSDPACFTTPLQIWKKP